MLHSERCGEDKVINKKAAPSGAAIACFTNEGSKAMFLIRDQILQTETVPPYGGAFLVLSGALSPAHFRAVCASAAKHAADD